MSRALRQVDGWDVPHVAAAVVGPDGVVAARGDVDRAFEVASVTKPLSAYALMVAVEEGAVELDGPAGPPGSTMRHLLAHTSGYGFDGGAQVLARPGTRRIYSNRGIEEAAARLEGSAGMPFSDYLTEAVLQPLGMASTRLDGSPAQGARSTVADLARFAVELFAPQILARESLDEMVQVQFPGLAGVLPGIGRFDPCDWGLGFERTFGAEGHWAGQRVSSRTFGHFGGAGTFLWLDPVAGVACICLTDRAFDAWALEAWPPLCDAVVAEAG
jgi:CubicO group peptidase (beta-lactamase class C family)